MDGGDGKKAVARTRSRSATMPSHRKKARRTEGGDDGEAATNGTVTGSAAEVDRRREACQDRRAAAVHALLDKIAPVGRNVTVDREALRKERLRLKASGGIVKKTAAKVATNAKSFQQYVKEMDVDVGECPTEDQAVEFALWLSKQRQRVCLAQRDPSTPRLKGVVKKTARNMLTELFAHDWPRRYKGFAAMDKPARALYERTVLELK